MSETEEPVRAIFLASGIRELVLVAGGKPSGMSPPGKLIKLWMKQRKTNTCKRHRYHSELDDANSKLHSTRMTYTQITYNVARSHVIKPMRIHAHQLKLRILKHKWHKIRKWYRIHKHLMMYNSTHRLWRPRDLGGDEYCDGNCMHPSDKRSSWCHKLAGNCNMNFHNPQTQLHDALQNKG